MFDIVTFGEAMIRLSPPNFKRLEQTISLDVNVGGTELNVAIGVSRLGLKSEFPLRKTLEQAQRYPLERLKSVYKRLLEADLSIKTGRYDGRLALNLL